MSRKKKRQKSGLAKVADEFAMALIYEASGGTIGRVRAAVKVDMDTPAEEKGENSVSFRDRRALLDSVTKLLGAQPDDKEDEDIDGIASFREALGGGNSREAKRRADNPPDEDEADVHAAS